MDKLTSGKLAKLTNINVESIRFYERKKLLPKPLRSESGYRLYSQDDVHKIIFIKKAQQLGFTLKEIKDLLNLRIDEDNSCADVQELIGEKIEEIEFKIREMKKIKSALSGLNRLCSTNDLGHECPLLLELNKINFL